MVAVVAGASGLTGSFLLSQFQNATHIDAVYAFVRKPLVTKHAKVIEVLFSDDFMSVSDQLPEGAIYFCCLGSTIKKAGSKQQFYFVDVTLVGKFIQLAESKSAQSFVLQSSVGAGSPGNNYYLSCKREAENLLLASKIPNKHIVRPSLLIGARNEFRIGERIAQMLMPVFNWMMIGKLRRYQSISAELVAKAMLNLGLKTQETTSIIESESIQDLASGR
jgi:uncharacterized protein YbjT (DUF2867 family)